MNDNVNHLPQVSDPFMSPKSISVVAPAYNESEGIIQFHQRLSTVLHKLGMKYEIVFINDGSKDDTLDKLKGIKERDSHTSIINLSRNFGKEAAMTAGLDLASGDAVVIIDTDLQDPPELIIDMIDKMKEGYDVVYAKRHRREGETFIKKLTAHFFYRVIQTLSSTRIPADTGDFRVMSRRAVNQLNRLREHHRFMKGLFAWVGFPQTEILYNRDQRFAGNTKWNYWKLWNFALEGITSFSTKPLKVASYVGLGTATLAFLYALYIALQKIIFGNPVAGYPSLMVAILFLGGVQLIALGVIGEYLARTFSETKNRPLYIVGDYFPSTLSNESIHTGTSHHEAREIELK